MSGGLDRTALEEILARQVPASSAGELVDLPSIGAKAYVRVLDGELDAKATGYATAPFVGKIDATGSFADGVDEGPDAMGELTARRFTATIRWALLDEDGNPLCRSYDEARQLVKALDIADLAAIQAAAQRGRNHQIGSVEEGKAL